MKVGNVSYDPYPYPQIKGALWAPFSLLFLLVISKVCLFLIQMHTNDYVKSISEHPN